MRPGRHECDRRSCYRLFKTPLVKGKSGKRKKKIKYPVSGPFREVPFWDLLGDSLCSWGFQSFVVARVVFRCMREDITCTSCSAQMRFVFSGYCILALSGSWVNSLYSLGSSFASCFLMPMSMNLRFASVIVDIGAYVDHRNIGICLRRSLQRCL